MLSRRFSFVVLSALSAALPAWGVEESSLIGNADYRKPESSLRFEAHGGLAFGNAALSTGLPTDNRVAMTVGVAAESPLVSGNLYLRPELNLVPKGGDNAHFGAKGLTTLTYLELPILLKAKFQLKRVQPFLLGGFGLGYLVGRGLPAGTNADLRAFDLTAQFGLGAAFRLNDGVDSSAVTVAVRYSSGLIDADAGPNSWYSQSYALLFGFQI